MAKKQHKESFAEMLNRLQAESIKPKPVETIEERKYFLIVCEGVRTEPNYFNYFKKFLPKHLIETIEIIGEGDNTINVVKKAIQERDKRRSDEVNPDYDEVWAVFDKDDFPAERFNEAVKLAGENGIESGHTNEAFELWYVLHFQYLDTGLNRTDYFKILSQIFGVKYEKNSQNLIEYLFEKGSVAQAIEWAKKLEQIHVGSTPSKAKPLTRIHVLVERLLIYSKHDS